MRSMSKQAKRTKKNSKPSNSGRSFELLGTLGSSYVSFQSKAEQRYVGIPPGFQSCDYVPQNIGLAISSEFQIVLKKMSKKDPVTRAKALQEFIELITQSNLETLKTILHWWPKLYASLANDVEPRVREAAQLAQSALATKTGKNLAPYLKQLVPVWVASQYDSYAPAGFAASNSFQNIFSASKIKEVFTFCNIEIFEYINQNLMVHSMQGSCNSKAHSNEEAESKYTRKISASLRTLEAYFKNVSSKTLLQNSTKVKNLYENQKFWNFSKHKSPSVRAAWFQCLYAGLQNAPFSIESCKKQTISTVFNCLAEDNPVVLKHVWECVILIPRIFIDWEFFIDFKGKVAPQLFLMLSAGGNESIIYSNLISFLSNLTNEVVDNELFYAELFDCIANRIYNSKDNIYLKSTMSKVISTFYECIRYFVQNVDKLVINQKDQQSSTISFVEKIVKTYVFDIVTNCLFHDSQISKLVFSNVSNLVAYWKQNTSELSCILVQQFWENIKKKLCIRINSGTFHSVECQKIIEFIECLSNPSLKVHGNNVKFTHEENESPVCTNTRAKHANIMELNDLRGLACMLGKLFITKIEEADEEVYVSGLKELCSIFNDIGFYQLLAEDSSPSSNVSKLVKCLQRNKSENKMLVSVVFDIIILLDSTAQSENINKLLKIPSKSIIQIALQRILSYPLCLQTHIRDIVRQEYVRQQILNTARDVVTEYSSEKINLLHKCFFQSKDGEIPINRETVDGIIEIMCQSLTHPKMLNLLEATASFIAQLLPSCTGFASKHIISKAFLKLFDFSLHESDIGDLSEDTIWEIATSWQDLLCNGDVILDDQLKKDCRVILIGKLANGNISLDNIDRTATLISMLIGCSTMNAQSNEIRDREIDALIQVFLTLEKASDTEIDETVLLVKYCSFFESLAGEFTTNRLENETRNISTSDIHFYFKQNYFNASVIYELICKKKYHDQEISVDSTDRENKIGEKLTEWWTLSTQNQILNAMLAASIGQSLIRKSVHILSDTIILVQALTEKLKIIMLNLDTRHEIVLKENLFEKICNDSAFWCRTILFNWSDKVGAQREYAQIANLLISQGNHISLMHVTQIFSSLLSPRAMKVTTPNFNNDFTVDIVLHRCLVSNYFSGSYNKIEDKCIIHTCLTLLEVCGSKLKDIKSLSKKNLSDNSCDEVLFMVETAYLMEAAIKYFPMALNNTHFDLIFINLCSWILDINNYPNLFTRPIISVFIAVVFKLHQSVCGFVALEQTRSSTKLLLKVVMDWQKLFGREANLLLLKLYMFIVNNVDKEFNNYHCKLLDSIAPCAEKLDFCMCFNISPALELHLNVDDVLKFALDSLSNIYVRSRNTALLIILKLIKLYVKTDLSALETRFTDPSLDHGKSEGSSWHFLNKFTLHHQKYLDSIQTYLNEFSFKLTELPSLTTICDRAGFSYLHLWHCIIYACKEAPPELKSIYAAWITDNNVENSLLYFLFRAMPTEILKNHDSNIMNNHLFKPLEFTIIEDFNITLEHYACHMYTMTLKQVPAIVRKWWQAAPTRQKSFIDKLTTNFVSNFICQEELRAICEKRGRYENMQVTVHISTREVIAIYSIDDARMELVVSLAMNHPLGPVKVEGRKQIGGRLQSKAFVMQLTIFLTHQNGSIFDGLLLWKKNLDKKFEGIEECYICYTVIHQDTCQLPKSSCSACKKKFHGPCLYKWFTTSSKSTCPICRNIF